MPSPMTFVMLALAAVFLHSGLGHLLSLLNRRRDPLSPLFGLMCLLGGAHALLTMAVYHSFDLGEHVALARWQTLLARLMAAAIPWFVALYADFKPRRFLTGLSAVFLLLALANLVLPTPLLFAEVTGIAVRVTPWGEEIASSAGVLSPAAYLIYAAVLASILFAAEGARRLWTRGDRGRAWPLLGPIAFAVVAFVNDTLLDGGHIRSIYLEEFVVFAFLLVIGMWLGARRVRAEGNYRTLFHAVSDGIFVHDARTGQVLDANESAARMSGLPRGELLAGNVGPTVVDAAGFGLDRAVAQIRKAATEGPRTFEWQSRRPDTGATLWSEVALRAEVIDGRPVVLAAARDISDRKKAEEALRDSENRYRAIVEAYDGLIYICSKDLKIEFMNSRMIARTGRDATGEPCHRALHDLEAPCEWCVNERVQKGETVRWQVQSPKDGRWFDIVNTPIRHPDGSVSKQAMITDITEQRKAEEERKALELQVLQVQKLESLGLLAGGVAHDFNNLLTAVLGNVELALRGLPASAEARAPLGEIRTIACRAADLCRQLLAYSGRGGFVSEPLQPRRIVEEISRILDVSVSRKVRLAFDFAADAPLVMGDPTQIRQVVMNLITNASEAIGDQEGAITLSMSRLTLDRTALREYTGGAELAGGAYMALEVRDTGCGMDENTRARIFEPFFSTKFTGRGLGMAAVLGIVRGHKGGIRVESQPGQGTTVTVVLPAAPADVRLPEEATPAPVVAAPARNAVLVVDDNARVLSAVSHLVEALGYPVLSASSGHQAIELFKARRAQVGCVLLDLTMPDMDGLEAFHQLKLLDPEVRVVLSSGYSEQSVRSRLRGEGPVAFLQKPFLEEDLRRTLEKATRQGPPAREPG